MKCPRCGNEMEEIMQGGFSCPNCKQNNNEKKKIKIELTDVINKESTLNATNKVAYIANGWALQIKNRGTNFAIIIVLIFFILAIFAVNNASYDDDGVFFSTFGMGILYAVLVVMIFNTVAFIIRMGAEIIQLLDDIKKSK